MFRRIAPPLALLSALILAIRVGLARLDARRGAMSRREHVALVLHRQADRRLSPLGVWVMRRTRGSLADLYHVQALVLTTTGRRTGQRRSVVLQTFADEDAFVVVATADGDDRPPAWYLNLAADPRAEIEVRGRRMTVRATELSADEGAAWWQRILRLAPDYERYARATSRAFPVLRLQPASSHRKPPRAARLTPEPAGMERGRSDRRHLRIGAEHPRDRLVQRLIAHRPVGKSLPKWPLLSVVQLVDDQFGVVQHMDEQHPHQLLVLGALCALALQGCGLQNPGPIAHADLILRIVNRSAEPVLADWTANGRTSAMTIGPCSESAQGVDAGTYEVVVTSASSRATATVAAVATTGSGKTWTALVAPDGSIKPDAPQSIEVGACVAPTSQGQAPLRHVAVADLRSAPVSCRHRSDGARCRPPHPRLTTAPPAA